METEVRVEAQPILEQREGDEEQENPREATEEEQQSPEVRVSFFKRHCGKVDWNLISHVGTNWMALIFFALSLLGARWRLFEVNRAALLLMADLGRIEGRILNTTVSFSREQGVFTECFVKSDLRLLNKTDVFFKPGCHSILANIEAGSANNTNTRYITGLFMAQMVLGPIEVILCLVATVIQIIGLYIKRLFVRLCFVNLCVRAFANFVSLIFFICAMLIASSFKSDDPAFPNSWPPAIRDGTDVLMWQLGCIAWLVGMLGQFWAMILDMLYAVGDYDPPRE